MSSTSSIEWTDATWNPVRGCTKVSPGCKHCYAETFAERWRGVAGHPYEQGFDLRLVPERLDEPLRWRKPRRVFVNSMSDLFQEGVPFEFIAAVYGVMAVSPHTFQVLTKRPERRLAFHRWLASHHQIGADLVVQRHAISLLPASGTFPLHPIKGTLRCIPWPLLNVWEGISAENQQTADERIPLLLQTPAAVRFVSAEPLLGSLDFTRIGVSRAIYGDALRGWSTEGIKATLDWIIVGGESGPGARPCDVAWIRSIVKRCHAAEVACFVKQLGRRPFFEVVGDESPKEIAATWNLGGTPEDRVLWDDAGECWLPQLRSRKGADSSEWPEDLRVQEFPNTNGAARPRMGGR